MPVPEEMVHDLCLKAVEQNRLDFAMAIVIQVDILATFERLDLTKDHVGRLAISTLFTDRGSFQSSRDLEDGRRMVLWLWATPLTRVGSGQRLFQNWL